MHTKDRLAAELQRIGLAGLAAMASRGDFFDISATPSIKLM